MSPATPAHQVTKRHALWSHAIVAVVTGVVSAVGVKATVHSSPPPVVSLTTEDVQALRQLANEIRNLRQDIDGVRDLANRAINAADSAKRDADDAKYTSTLIQTMLVSDVAKMRDDISTTKAGVAEIRGALLGIPKAGG